MTSLVHVTTVPQTATCFLAGQLRWMVSRGFDVTLVTSAPLPKFAQRERIKTRRVAMRREISPFHDLRAVLAMRRVFREIRPEIVHAHTPKAGLVAMSAARLCNVPIRIYHLHGLRLETSERWMRRLLWRAEKCSCDLSTDVLCVSDSLRRVAVAEQLATPDRLRVLQHGSANGLDSAHFDPNRQGKHMRRQTRDELGIPRDGLVLGFVGRLVRDKGIVELATAWKQLRSEFPQLHLLLVGPFESGDAVPDRVQDELRNDARVRLTGHTEQTTPYYAAMDVMTLPSHREGLGTVLLEAASMRLPTVACRVTGCVDAIVDGKTGILVPRQNPDQLAAALRQYLRDDELRQAHGRAGRARIVRDFQPLAMWQAIYDHYLQRLGARRQWRIERPELTLRRVPQVRQEGVASRQRMCG